VDPDYDFMDNLELVKAVTDVRLKSDIAGAGSLIGALANRTNEENQKLYDRMVDTMLNKLGYCKTCAQKTIEYFCTQEDEKNKRKSSQRNCAMTGGMPLPESRRGPEVGKQLVRARRTSTSSTT
jgi:ATP sulfurylase